MLQDKLVSVIMPVYNGAQFLKQAVDSILQQTYKNIELIVINDGSTDASLSVLKSYNDTRVKLIHFENNQGLIAALNAGMQAAQGELIARMDADDVSLPERIQIQVQAFEKDNSLIACDTDYYQLFENNKRKLSSSTLNTDALKGALIFTTCFCHPAVMMRKVFDRQPAAYDQAFTHVEDYKLWTDLALRGKFAHIAKPLLLYRSHSAQVSNQHHHLQLAKSAEIRANYLQAMGFELNAEQLNIINIIGNNEFIRSKQVLTDIEKVLLLLQMQNQVSKKLHADEFLQCLQKFWLDSCGFTNLGVYAFKCYLKSDLSRGATDICTLSKLLAKCLLRGRKQ